MVRCGPHEWPKSLGRHGYCVRLFGTNEMIYKSPKQRRRDFINTLWYIMHTRGYLVEAKHPGDPWEHIPNTEIVKVLKIWDQFYKTSVPLMQFVEQTLGSTKPKAK